MLTFFLKIRDTKPSLFGVLIALFGILVLTPDTLVIRLSELERWPLLFWRGILMGAVLMLGWRLFFSQNPSFEWRSLFSWQGLIVIIAFSMNSITFTLGIVETSATVVLTAVATMPVFAAALSFFMLGERQGWLGWLTILAAMVGIVFVVLNGEDASGGPKGSAFVGGFFGLLTALALAIVFTIARKYQDLSVFLAAAIGAFLSGLVGLYMSNFEDIVPNLVWPVLLMGLIILPISFACLSHAPHFTSSALVSLLMLLEMIIGPFWVWLGVGEKPSPKMICGSAFVALIIGAHILRTQWLSPQKSEKF